MTATAREAEDLTAALGSLLPDGVRRHTSRLGRRSRTSGCRPRSDTSGPAARGAAQARSPRSGRPQVRPAHRLIATPVRCLLQPMVGGLGELEPVRLRRARRPTSRRSCSRLVEIGYARSDLVEKRGDIAVRGGILDVFPPTEEHPLRVDFFGDEVEEVRYFKVADQRSLEVAAGRPVGAALPRAAADAGGPGAGQGARPRMARPGRGARPSWPTGSPSRAWRRSRRRCATGWSCCSTTCRAAA